MVRGNSMGTVTSILVQRKEFLCSLYLYKSGKINNYSLNINSRELIKNERSLKLTQKEVEVIVYLNNSDNSMPISSLQKEVWGHNSSLETHTVETHIYRLRRKISQKFGDNQFIKSFNDGYKI